MCMPYLLYIIETIVLTILLGFVGIPLAKKYKARQSSVPKVRNLIVPRPVHRPWADYS